ncbi:bifunctional DNA-formamidopyrimidine glycosylase/DNA-(apurinic or apyrimidinic site) lyase [Entomospira entomophila]|uniref:Bifunctional DNA-formamidopyrimidine glycosylase/DNA-(Apurinic or apyrimidinic site) lyase n=1 Tax=Entomospira entomophila TaxID=2719988 RepID=A0A968KRH8_9SPIO|nr:bifunctional DNA-formamidopyrimidine glycosylase/DNA-(apurinic or apyrimidinic site) lyase [Entomospira entomophilus]NIZ40768.1 bifunctional DNA-formamidopyrimidine glycosylase/DNA-(apurinic or apyrimidinic site) lyase [Entomospira entomophilus]WDI34981.1 bifunctional DNA-formamidopyrimidine glycosylase/DNA-(apurinic or apyrimidinic site) lyase [Entomospira entomophilus]
MPELPEVESVRQALLPYINQVIEHVTIHDTWLRETVPSDLSEKLVKKKLLDIQRISKYLVWHIEDAPALLLHLGMSGRIEGRYQLEKHDKVSWTFFNTSLPPLYFNDARRFGLIVWADSYQLPKLGPEPLTDAFTPQYLAHALAIKRTPIKVALLDQAIIAGLGNIYVCEALYHARISPLRPANTLSTAEYRALYQAINKVIDRAITLSGSTWRDYRKPDGESGLFQNEFMVYDREGELTEHGLVVRIKQAGRSTYYCPYHQT